MLKPPCLMALDWFHHHSRSPDHLFSPFWALWARHLSVLRTNHRRGRSVRPAVGSASRNKSSSGFWFQIHLPLAPGRVRAEVSERVGHQRPTGRSLDWMQEWMSWWIEIQERHGWLNFIGFECNIGLLNPRARMGHLQCWANGTPTISTVFF